MTQTSIHKQVTDKTVNYKDQDNTEENEFNEQVHSGGEELQTNNSALSDDSEESDNNSEN